MPKRILHVLSQRPGHTGSGMTLQALVRNGDSAGYEQWVVAGIPADDNIQAVGGLTEDRFHPVRFGTEPLAFPIPGMSDVMPYESTVWADMSGVMLAQYIVQWQAHLRRVIEEFKPDLIHAHHLWLMSSLLPELAGEIPVVVHSHATGLRQMELCPALAPDIQSRLKNITSFVVLHEGHRDSVIDALGVEADRVSVVGAGYREDVFHDAGRLLEADHRLIYVGKYSKAKGLPELLDAVERLSEEIPDLLLEVAGTGSGDEADTLRKRMEAMPQVELLGQLDPEDLATHMRGAHLFVLPSYYEGLPLVLVEAVACGCRAVCTDLPGVASLAKPLEEVLDLVALPPMLGVDTPDPEGIPEFVDRLTESIRTALGKPLADHPDELAAPFTWKGVFERVDEVWRRLLS